MHDPAMIGTFFSNLTLRWHSGGRSRGRWRGLIALWLVLTGLLSAQDGLNLPTELYVLRLDGTVEQYGLGTAGVRTVTPADVFVVDFGVAPDRNHLAYRTEDGLYVLNTIRDGEPQQLEGASAGVPLSRGRGDTIAWSPEGDALAYTTLEGGRVHFLDGGFVDLETPNLLSLEWSPDGRYLAAAAQNDVWWIYRRAEGAMTLASAIPQAFGATWTSLTEMVFAPPQGGLTLMDMAENNRQTPLLQPERVYRLPHRQADGSLLVFGDVARENPNQAAEADAPQQQLYLLRFSADEINAQPIGEPFTLEGGRWSPDGNWLTRLQGGVLALINPQNGEGLTLPISGATAYAWGPSYPPEVPQLTLPANGYFLSAADGIRQVWRLPADGSQPLSITPAASDISAYAISPDQSRVAYVSAGALWLHAPGSGREPLSLIELSNDANGIEVAPAFGPEGETLYYRDRIDTTEGIWQLNVRDDASSAPAPFALDDGQRAYLRAFPANGVSAVALSTREADGSRGLAVWDRETGDEIWSLTLAPPENTRSLLPPTWLSASRLLFQGRIRRGDVVIEGLHLLDVNNRQEPPFTLLPVGAELEVLSVAQVTPNILRVLTRSRGALLAPVRVREVPLDGGEGRLIAGVGFADAPTLTPDGALVAGLSRPDGLLLLTTLETGAQLRLARPQQMSAFRWAR